MPSHSPEDPRWLSDAELHVWLELMRVILTLPGALDAQLRRDSGLTHYEYLVLAMLSEQADGVLSMTVLSTLTNGSLSRLSHVITRMEKANLVRRQPSSSDGRTTDVVLTKTGRGSVERAAPGHVDTARHLVFDHLSPRQLEQLAKVLPRLAPQTTP